MTNQLPQNNQLAAKPNTKVSWYHATPNFWVPVGAGVIALGFILYRNVVVPDPLNDLFDAAHKVDYYAAIASSLASLLGFLITAATIFLTMGFDHFQRLAENQLLRPLFGVFVYAIGASGIALIASIIGLFFDRNTILLSSVIQAVTCVSLIMAMAYLCQTISIFSSMGNDLLVKIENKAIGNKAQKRNEIEKAIGDPDSDSPQI
jgi:hypothetical protein